MRKEIFNDTTRQVRIDPLRGHPAGTDIRSGNLQCPNPCETHFVISGFTATDLDTYDVEAIAQCLFCDFTDFRDLYIWDVERLATNHKRPNNRSDIDHLIHPSENEIKYAPPTPAEPRPRQCELFGCTRITVCTCMLPAADDLDDDDPERDLIMPTHRCAKCDRLIYTGEPKTLAEHNPRDSIELQPSPDEVPPHYVIPTWALDIQPEITS